jgi:NADH-quinone oxidoreductase subunit C
MTPQEIHDALKASFGDAIAEAKLNALQPWIRLAPDRTHDVCVMLYDDPRFRFDYLMCLSGVDYNGGNLGVVYHLYSTIHKHKIVLRASCTKEQPHVQTVSDIWRTAEWHEREAYDMLGIVFDGNRDLRRILLPDDWEGHPLRKDYKVPEFYHGIKVPY